MLTSIRAGCDTIGSGGKLAALPTRSVIIPLRVVNSGRLNPWPAPAIRGMVLKPLREQLCQLSADQRAERVQLAPGDEHYCRACTFNADCLYGRSLEPDRLIINQTVSRGQREGLRAVTFASNFPFRSSFGEPAAETDGMMAQPGDRLLCRLLMIGLHAFNLEDRILRIIAHAGQQFGLGSVRFTLDQRDAVVHDWKLDYGSLPIHPGNQVAPELHVTLTTPLFLKERPKSAPQFGPVDKRVANDPPRRYTRQEAPPTFGRLFRESIRTIRRAVNEYADAAWLNDIDLGPLLRSADEVETHRSAVSSLMQERTSARRGARWQMRGLTGNLIYRRVPRAHLPWLSAAGYLGVGDSRNCGAGLWKVKADSAREAAVDTVQKRNQEWKVNGNQ